MEPLITETEKRSLSLFIPYRRLKDGIEFFLQKRDGNAPTDPNIFSLFGGGIEENETPAHALAREVREELVYTPRNLGYFSKYETSKRICYVFIEEVGYDFESLVDVQEGEYGKFLPYSEIEFSKDVSFIARTIIHSIHRSFEKHPLYLQ
jgi:8-oxo-dGTP pyrophosphatase MutT (NUDIX family)